MSFSCSLSNACLAFDGWIRLGLTRCCMKVPGVCVYVLYLLSCYRQPEGLWQQLAPALTDSAPIFPPLEVQDPDPVPNDMCVVPGLPFLLPPRQKKKRKTENQSQPKQKPPTAEPLPRTPTSLSPPGQAQPHPWSPARPPLPPLGWLDPQSQEPPWAPQPPAPFVEEAVISTSEHSAGPPS